MYSVHRDLLEYGSKFWRLKELKTVVKSSKYFSVVAQFPHRHISFEFLYSIRKFTILGKEVFPDIFKNLERLTTEFQRDCVSIRNLTNIEELIVRWPTIRVTNVNDLANLTKLKKLHIAVYCAYDENISKQYICNATKNLEYLALHTHPSNITWISSFTNLNTLVLSQKPEIETIRNLRNLTRLVCFNNEVTTSGFSCLTNLKIIHDWRDYVYYQKFENFLA